MKRTHDDGGETFLEDVNEALGAGALTGILRKTSFDITTSRHEVALSGAKAKVKHCTSREGKLDDAGIGFCNVATLLDVWGDGHDDGESENEDMVAAEHLPVRNLATLDGPPLLGHRALASSLPYATLAVLPMAFRQEPTCIVEPSPSANQRLELEQTHTAELAVLCQLLRAKSDELRQAEIRERAAQEKLAEETTARKEAEAQAGKEKHAKQLAEAEAGAAKERLAAVARESKVREAQDRAEVATPLSVAVEQASLLEASRSTQARLSEALREAESSARSRDEFLAVMNHEIRTPLHAIIALLSLLNQSELTEDQQSMVHTVSKSTTLLCTLINDVLDFSRLEGDSLALDPHPFHLPSLFEQLEALARSMAQVKGVQLVVWIDEEIPAYVSGDDQRILQVLLNLVANSIKFTEPGGRITVKASRVEGESSSEYLALKVTVTDTGMGIRPEDLDGKLFQKFVQADTSISRKYGGTGLGLAICKKLAEMMQGRIWLESDGVGRGCTASLVLRLQHARAPKVLKSPLLESNALKGLQALVTDDNAINRLVTSRLLTSLGCEVAVAEGGRSCLEQLALQRFGLVLLDLSMPDMDGFQVFESIKRTYPSPVRPLVVALTANSDQLTRDRCTEVGMDAIILKPVTVSDLREAICSLLESSRFRLQTQPQNIRAEVMDSQ